MVESDDEYWLVAGGEPGAQRFGQLVQRCRKQRQLSVDDLARQAGLSVGTIRAIEQGRRAPSEASGARLLQLLLPQGALIKEAGVHVDYSFTDPLSGARIQLKFRAKTAGDNSRWSIDKPRPEESEVEAKIRELMSDPEWSAGFLEQAGPGFELLARVFTEAGARAQRPAGDAQFGKVTRRLTTVNEFRLDRIMKLVDWWDAVDGGTADAAQRDLSAQVDKLIDSYYRFPDEDLPGPTE